MADNYQTQEQYSSINELNTRIRILEGKYTLTRERMLIINQNMIEHYKKLSSDMKSIKEDISEVKESMDLLKDTIKDVVKELRLLARKDEFKVLEKYINLWNPVNNVTKEEVIDLIKKEGKNARRK